MNESVTDASHAIGESIVQNTGAFLDADRSIGQVKANRSGSERLRAHRRNDEPTDQSSDPEILLDHPWSQLELSERLRMHPSFCERVIKYANQSDDIM